MRIARKTYFFKRQTEFWCYASQSSNLIMPTMTTSDSSVLAPLNVTGVMPSNMQVPLGTGSTGLKAQPAQTYAWGMNFSLDKIVNASEFATLFDEYKIAGVRVQFNVNFNSAQPNHNNNLPYMRCYVDNDDSATPNSSSLLSEFQQRAGVVQKRLGPGGGISMYFKPKMLMAAATSAGGNVTEVTGNSKWCDMAQTNMAHYGLKCLLQDFPSSISGTDEDMYKFALKGRVTYYVKFRGAR